MTDFSKYQANSTTSNSIPVNTTDFSKYAVSDYSAPQKQNISLADSIINAGPELVGVIGRQVKDAFTGGIGQIKTGFNQNNSPLEATRGALNIGAGIVNSAFSPIAPIFKPISDVTSYIGDKIGDSKNIQKFAQSPTGEAVATGAEMIGNASTIAGAVVGASETLPKVNNFLKQDLPSLLEQRKVASENLKNDNIVKNRVEDLKKIDTQYAKLRKTSSYSADARLSNMERIANTDVLVGSVDNTGTLRTKQPGGAIQQYKEQTIKGTEGIVRDNLAEEGASISPETLSSILKDKIENNPTIKGKAKTQALSNIDAEVKAYGRNGDGDIPLTEVHDAKVATYNIVGDYATPAEYKTYQKALGNGLKTAIEKTSSLPIEDINKEIGKYLGDIKFLEQLDGTKVSGGKLGKYFAQISGNIIGGATGGAVGGPVGSALGTVIGGEIAGGIKGSIMKGKFGRETGMIAPSSEILQKAKLTSQLYKEGNLNQQYNKINTSNININKSIPQDISNANKELDIVNNANKLNIDNSIFSEIDKTLPEDLIKKGMKLEIQQQALENSPFKNKDNRFMVDKEGRVIELGDLNNRTLIKKIEDRIAEDFGGNIDPTEFANELENYLKQKKELEENKKLYKEEVKKYKQRHE